MKAMLVQSGCGEWRGSPLGDAQFSLVLRLSPSGLTSDSLAEQKGKAARTVSIPHSHTSLRTYPLSKCFLSSYLEVTLQGPLSSSSSADLLPAELCSAMQPCLLPPPRALLLTFAGDTERKCKPETHTGRAPGWCMGRKL